MKLTITLNYEMWSAMPKIHLGGKLLGGEVTGMMGYDAIKSCGKLRKFVQDVADESFDSQSAIVRKAKRVIYDTNTREAKDHD